MTETKAFSYKIDSRLKDIPRHPKDQDTQNVHCRDLSIDEHVHCFSGENKFQRHVERE